MAKNRSQKGNILKNTEPGVRATPKTPHIRQDERNRQPHDHLFSRPSRGTMKPSDSARPRPTGIIGDKLTGR